MCDIQGCNEVLRLQVYLKLIVKAQLATTHKTLLIYMRLSQHLLQQLGQVSERRGTSGGSEHGVGGVGLEGRGSSGTDSSGGHGAHISGRLSIETARMSAQ